MHINKTFKYIALPARTICTFLILAWLIVILQIISIEIYQEFYQKNLNQPSKEKPKLTTEEQQQKEIDYADKEFTPDGTVYLVQRNIVVPDKFGEKKTIIKNQNGDIVYEGNEEDIPLDFISFQEPLVNNRYQRRSSYGSRSLNSLRRIQNEFSRNYIVPIVNNNNKRIAHWVFDADRQIFKGYSVSGEKLGFLGSNGYAKDLSTVQSLGDCESMDCWADRQSYDPILLYQSQYAVYQINFNNRQVETLAKTDHDQIIRITQNNWKEIANYDYRPVLDIRTESGKLYVHLKNPVQTIKCEIPNVWPQIAAIDDKIWIKTDGYVDAPKTNDREEYIKWLFDGINQPRKKVAHLFKLEADGALQERGSFVWTQPARKQTIGGFGQPPNMFHSIINSVSSPVPGWILRFLYSKPYLWPDWLSWTFRSTGSILHYRLIVNLTVMTIFAGLTFLHGRSRRTHITKLISWMIFVFLFNLPGFLTYLALNHFPVTHCSNCGKKRGLLQNTCSRCGSTLPLPQSKETDLISAIG